MLYRRTQVGKYLSRSVCGFRNIAITRTRLTEIWSVSRHPENGGLQVPLVASEIDKCDDLGGLLADFHPVQ